MHLTGFTVSIPCRSSSSEEIEFAITEGAYQTLNKNGLVEMAEDLLSTCANSLGIHDILDKVLVFMGVDVFVEPDEPVRSIYDFAVKVTDERLAEATFEALIGYCRLAFPNDSREVLEGLVRNDLGYYAGYYDHETRQRVERIYRCEHPYFGKAGKDPITPKEAFRLGQELAEKHKKKS